jgi:RNA-binding protein
MIRPCPLTPSPVQAHPRYHLHLIADESAMSLTNAQKKHLRGLGHELDPVVIVADKGLTENVRGEVEQALAHHELIKVKLRADRARRQEWIDALASETGAEVVHSIGQVVCLFRRNSDKPKIQLP